jgi:broad specificity phosphatase PhoE
VKGPQGSRSSRWREAASSVPWMLYLVRHGRTEANASRRLLGRLDIPLDELGRRQAGALGRVPFLREAERVVTSPLIRTVETAEALGPPVTVDERWVEIDYGVHDGADVDGVPELFAQWAADLSFSPEGGESLAAVGCRVRQAGEDLSSEAADHDVVVVTHVSPLKAAVAWALGVGDEILWRMFVDLASVSVIGCGRGLPTLRVFNDTSHRPSQ